MDDRSFFDLLYQQWAKTTGAEDKFWMPEKDEDFPDWNISAVDQNQERWPVAQGVSEVDADFITAIHGCFGDLVKRLHDALDEADRLDTERDERENEIAHLARENQDAWQKIDYLVETMRKMDQDLIKANADLVYWQDIAQSVEAQR